MSFAPTDTAPILAPNPFDWPLFGLDDDVRPALADARARRAPVVLATLFAVGGGAPRGIGAQMAFVDGRAIGCLSGGCVEADLALHAERVLVHGRHQTLVYGQGGPLDIRLICGSSIEVLLERLMPDDGAVEDLLRFTGERRPALWLTDGDQRVCLPEGALDQAPARLRGALSLAQVGDAVCGHARAPFAAFRRFAPRRRLVAVGSDPIALAVVKLGAEVGFETILVRPRGPETCPLPNIQYVRSDVREALRACHPDRWTAIAVLTHDLEQEHVALKAALVTDAGYVGALGSRRRVPERNARLAASGLGEAALNRVHAPIGLPISGRSPWEIAVSVIAEIVGEMADGR
jgi:xanthine dehydrogenase accessory factor